MDAHADWCVPEEDFRWTDGSHATVPFTIAGAGDGTLSINLRPYLVPTHTVPVAARLLRAENVLQLRLPDAAAPMAVEISADARRLGVAVRWIRWSQ